MPDGWIRDLARAQPTPTDITMRGLLERKRHGCLPHAGWVSYLLQLSWAVLVYLVYQHAYVTRVSLNFGLQRSMAYHDGQSRSSGWNHPLQRESLQKIPSPCHLSGFGKLHNDEAPLKGFILVKIGNSIIQWPISGYFNVTEYVFVSGISIVLVM